MTYKYKEEVYNGLFMRIHKELFLGKYWAALPLASKAVYPVIYKFVNEQGSCFPSLETIATIAGITEKTASKGVKGLHGFPGFYLEEYITSRGRKGYRYKIGHVPKVKGNSFSISHSFFNGGNWSQITPTAKAVYLTLKCFAFWEFNLYEQLEETDTGYGGEQDLFIARKYDFVNPEPDVIAKVSGINTKSIRSAYQSLVDHHFMEELGNYKGFQTWSLFTVPPKYYKREYLNEQIEKRHAVLH